MTDPRVAHFQSLLAYERNATALVARSLESAPPASRTDPAYTKALGIFAHTQQAAHLWLTRLGVLSPRPFEMFPHWTPQQTVADAAPTHAALEEFLAALDGSGLERSVAYASLDGTPYLSTVAQILTHLFNHATYHRGQIATLVAAAGGERATTDFIVFTRVKNG